MSYNGRMIQNTRIKVEPIPVETNHNIRVFSFINGLILVAWITESDNGSISCVFPMELVISLEYDDSIVEYEFTPYLENLAEFDINKPYNFVFPIVALQSVSVPSHHLVRNYMGQLLLMKKVSDEEKGIPESETIH